MGIKGDDVVNAHLYQLLQSECAVQGFPCGALVLAAFIKERHDNGNSSCFTADSSDDTLQILIMIVRRHMVFMTAEGIGLAVVGYVNQQIQIRTADRFQNNALGFAGTKTWHLAF